jgi:hypothetical protein
MLKMYGEKALYDMWVKFNGMYRMSEYLRKETGISVTPYMVRYWSNKYCWTREITDTNLPIFKGILNNRVAPEYYKHIRFVMKEVA